MTAELAPFGLPIFLAAFFAYSIILEKLNFPNSLMSKEPMKRKIQAIVIIVIFLFIMLYIRSLNLSIDWRDIS